MAEVLSSSNGRGDGIVKDEDEDSPAVNKENDRCVVRGFEEGESESMGFAMVCCIGGEVADAVREDVGEEEVGGGGKCSPF